MTLQRILHVDDEPDLRELVRMTLEALGGFEVDSCASGPEAIVVARMKLPDLIILDVMMPNMDGPATLAVLRSDLRTASIPAIFMTAKSMPAEIERLRSLGALGVIAKPFDPMALSDSVREFWAEHQHARGIGTTIVDAMDLVVVDVPEEILPASGLADLQRQFRSRANEADQRLAAIDINSFQQGLGLEQKWLLEVREIAHKLAGSGMTFGHPAVSTLAVAVEDAANAALMGHPNTRKNLAEAIATLRAELSKLAA